MPPSEIGYLPASAVLDFIHPGARILVPAEAAEPATLLDAIDAAGPTLQDVQIHWMDPFTTRPFQQGAYPGRLTHVNYFLGAGSRDSYHAGHSELVCANFSQIPAILRGQVKPTLAISHCSLPDAEGYVSLGTNADYVASFIGTIPFFLEVNPHVPYTYGAHRLHVSQVAGFCYSEAPLLTVTPPPLSAVDESIAEYVAADIPDRSCLQIGVGRVPNALLGHLADHQDLGLHSEAISDGAMQLIEEGVITGVYKRCHPGKHVATFAVGSPALMSWLNYNPTVELLPVEETNNPAVIAQERRVCAINATSEVNLWGECCSETIEGRYFSAAGGQPDFCLGALWSPEGRSYIVTPSTGRGGKSRIVVRTSPGNVVTTSKNLVDNVVTEWGIARLRGRTVTERAQALIAIAHPDQREQLEREAWEAGILRGSS